MARSHLNAAIIGLGVGERHISGYEADPRCRVVALCDLDAQKLQEVGARSPGRHLASDPQVVLKDPDIDIVSIASYDNVHCEQVVMALDQGKHVFVEKPLCLFPEEFHAITTALARNPHLKLSSNLILRRTPRFIQLRERILRGDLGQVYYLEGDYDYGRLHKIVNGWRGKIPFYSVVHGGAIHLIDLLLWLTQKRVERVFAWGNKLATAETSFRYFDFVVALLNFRDGTQAKVTANFASVTPHHHKLCVYGTSGSFVQSHLGAAYLTSRDPSQPMEAVTDGYPGTAKGDMLPSFVRAVLDGTSPDVTAEEVLEAMAVALAIEASLASHQPEPVNYDWQLTP
ncbi:Gfo/Idh/MocA family protein [Leptolyngbya sp. PCC 6406]|uniref:Gfo/Idh/MocA family protein n=1 Tax=Leptolyngbya sp. PCC 6406 TaxID=1173264 RepID=UPI0002AD1110|nr:Gfo/Idh/MocA family oxidoreductase [Leptolyngbya sp. PCC 6406]